MRTVLFVSVMMLATFCGNAQTNNESGIKMIATYSSEDADLRKVLRFSDIDYWKVRFVGRELAGKDYKIITQEIWDGNVQKVDTIVNTKRSSSDFKIKGDTLALNIVAQKTHDDKLKIYIDHTRFGTRRKFNATPSEYYSFRVLKPKDPIELNKKFYAFAYILPYEKDGKKMWCAVDQSGNDVGKWGEIFKIKHYLTFEMVFE